MAGIGEAASIIAIIQITDTTIEHVKAWRHAGEDRKQFIEEATSLVRVLKELEKRIEDDGSADVQRQLRTIKLMEGPLQQCLVHLQKMKDKVEVERGLQRALQRIGWKYKRLDFQETLQYIHRIQTLAQLAMQLDVEKLSREIHGDVRATRQSGASWGIALNDVKLRLDDAHNQGKLRETLDWISIDDHAQVLRSHRTKYGSVDPAHTGQWFLQSPELISWLSGLSKVLVCSGFPGTGKSVMASRVVDSVLEDKQKIALYLFCDHTKHSGFRDDDHDEIVTDLLSALLRQVVSATSIIPLKLGELYKHNKRTGTRLSLLGVQDALRNTLEGLDEVYLVVDALDECDPLARLDLLPYLLNLVDQTRVRLLTTSRHVDELLKDFDHVEIRATDADIRAFVESPQQKRGRILGKNADLDGKVTENVVRTSQGMFMLAKLRMDALRQKRTSDDIEKDLQTANDIHNGIRIHRNGNERSNDGEVEMLYDRMYRITMERIRDQQDKNDATTALRALECVIAAKRPLHVRELQHAIAVRPGSDDITDGNSMYELNAILEICAGLLTTEEAGVRLVHLTAKEYLLRTKDAWHPGTRFSLLHSCLTYMTFRAFSEEVATSGQAPALNEADPEAMQAEMIKLRDRYALLYYIHNYVGAHLQDAEIEMNNEDFAELVSTAKRLFERPKSLAMGNCVIENLYFSSGPFAPISLWSFLATWKLQRLHRCLVTVLGYRRKRRFAFSAY